MKKTLITLAALAMASVASAANGVADDYTDSISNGRFWATDTSDSYTWIAVMDWDSVANKLGNWQNKSSIYATDNWNADAALGPVLFRNDEGNLVIQFVEHNKDLTNAANLYDITTGTLTDLTLTNNDCIVLGKGYSVQGKVVLTMVYDDTAKTYTFGAMYNDYSIATITFTKDSTWDKQPYNGADFKGKVADALDGFAWYGEALSGSALQYAMQTSIPEPATATLSLLALAGLAARRRRK